MGRNMGDCDHGDPAEGLDLQQCDKLGKRRSREEDELDSSLQHLLELRDSLSSSKSKSSETTTTTSLLREDQARNERPKSFLREEMDEFDRIFSELFARRQPMTTLAEEVVERRFSRPGGAGRSPSEKCSPSEGYTTQTSRTSVHEETTSTGAKSKANCSTSSNSDHFQEQKKSSRDSGLFEGEDSSSFKQGDEGDKLFGQLLDDLDNITGDTPSVRRRRRARDLFSNWLFNPEVKSPAEKSVLRRKRVHAAFADFAARRRSAEFPSSCSRREDLFTKWRPKSFEYRDEEDDADSGYHTGNNTLQSETSQDKTSTAPTAATTTAPEARTAAASRVEVQTAAPAAPPGERTLTREDLRRRIEAFNNNEHGLIMTLEQTDNTFQGFIRVHMNLIRPINMSISARPPSIYEVLAHEEPAEPDGSTEITSFYLPKGTTKVIHIDSETTAQEVIRALLTKFRITDNPRKFALYEKILVEGKRGTMRRLTDEMQPLPICLEWTSEGLSSRQLILQENDTGEIIWEAFSIPELENFLRILDREEQEYAEQVKAKYQLLKIQMNKRLREMDKERTAQDDKRQPVFV